MGRCGRGGELIAIGMKAHNDKEAEAAKAKGKAANAA